MSDKALAWAQRLRNAEDANDEWYKQPSTLILRRGDAREIASLLEAASALAEVVEANFGAGKTALMSVCAALAKWRGATR